MSSKTLIRATSALALCLTATAAFAQDTTITIATVNNGDMIRMQGYTDQFTEATGIAVEWVTLEENVLRQRVTTDITTKGGQFDIMTIGMYEAPIWGANGWLVPLDGLSEEYNVDDKHTNCVSVPKITLKQLLDAPKTCADAKHQNGVFVAKITLK